MLDRNPTTLKRDWHKWKKIVDEQTRRYAPRLPDDPLIRQARIEHYKACFAAQLPFTLENQR